MQKTRVRLAPHERRELRKRVRTRTLRADDVRRARLILMLAEGQSYTAIQAALDCNATFITRWKARFVAERLAGLYARHRGKAVATRTPKLEAKILERTRRPPRDGSTHWSTRKLARELGVSHMMVARVWGRANLKPHRLDRYMRSTDPRVRDEGGRHHRLVRQSAPARRGLLRRREDGDPSSRSPRPGAAAVAGARRTARLRAVVVDLQPPVLGVAGQRDPVVAGVGHRLPERALRQRRQRQRVEQGPQPRPGSAAPGSGAAPGASAASPSRPARSIP